MSEIQVFSSGTQFIAELPSGEQFKLEALEGYEELGGDQKLWLSHYLQSNLQKTMTSTITGVSVSKVNHWCKNDEQFNYVKDQLEDIYTEGLASLDLMEGFTNQKVRSRVLTARKAKGYEKEKGGTTNNNLIVQSDGLKGLLENLKKS